MFRVGIIGLGIISKSHLTAYEMIKMADIVAVCDIAINEETKASFLSKGIKVYTDYHQMIEKEKLDMVDICLPTYLHKDAVVCALEHGLHTLVEKPMAVSMEEVAEIKKAEATSKGRFMTAHVSRFKPQSMFLKKLIDEGTMGKPEYFHTWRFSSNPEPRFKDWLLDYSRGGHTIFDFQVHDIDLACWYLGKPKEYHNRKVASQKQNDLGYFISELEFDTGAFALMEISHVMPDRYSFTSGMSMLFEYGQVETSFRSDSEGWFNICTNTELKKYHYSELPVSFCRNPYGEEIASFIDSIQRNKPFLITSDESGLAVEVSRKIVANSGKVTI